MTAISATRRQMKEMADGTIRVQVDIDPAFRAAFLQAFPSIDMPIALAPLVRDFERRPEAPKDQPKGGAGAKWLAIRCAEESFWEFLGSIASVAPRSEAEAAAVVRDYLQVASRAEVDTDPDAKARFDELRMRWIDWCAEND